MRRRVLRGVQAALLPTVALGVVIGVLPHRVELAVHVWVLTMATIAVTVAVATLRAAYPATPSSFDAQAGALAEPPRMEGLDRAEREIALSMSSAFDAHLRLRPALREIASGLLTSRRGVDLERRPARAERILGAELWELVRPDREPPARRHDGGLGAAEIDGMLTTLERL